MADDRSKRLSKMEIGEWAQHYASRPYDHYKTEVYALFIDILRHQGSDIRVLDVGAGPGHLAREYFRRCRNDKARFLLLDVSPKLLAIAQRRLKRRQEQVETCVRDFNSDGWDRGIGKFDAIVSNNSLFVLWPERLEQFYRTCYRRLKRGGLLLNQQAFAWDKDISPYGDDPFAAFMQALPDEVLAKLPGLSKRERLRLDEERRLAAEEHGAAIERVRATGQQLVEERGYQFLSVDRHLQSVRMAGFDCGCIWRKREFAVILGVKGWPAARP